MEVPGPKLGIEKALSKHEQKNKRESAEREGAGWRETPLPSRLVSVLSAICLPVDLGEDP